MCTIFYRGQVFPSPRTDTLDKKCILVRYDYNHDPSPSHRPLLTTLHFWRLVPSDPWIRRVVTSWVSLVPFSSPLLSLYASTSVGRTYQERQFFSYVTVSLNPIFSLKLLFWYNDPHIFAGSLLLL